MSCENEHLHLHGDHNHGNGNGDDHDHDHNHIAPVPTSVAQLLNSKIDSPLVTAFNIQNEQEDLAKMFKNAESRYLLKPIIKSDADEQIILHIPFLNGSVKLHLVILRTNGDKYCPRTIELWKNNRGIDFDSVEQFKPNFKVTHPHVGVAFNDDEGDENVPDFLESDADFVEHHLPRHLFTGVQHLTMFFKNIYGDEEECHIHSIELRGEFTELTKDPVITIYEAAANPADHKRVEAANFQMSMN